MTGLGSRHSSQTDKREQKQSWGLSGCTDWPSQKSVKLQPSWLWGLPATQRKRKSRESRSKTMVSSNPWRKIGHRLWIRVRVRVRLRRLWGKRGSWEEDCRNSSRRELHRQTPKQWNQWHSLPKASLQPWWGRWISASFVSRLHEHHWQDTRGLHPQELHHDAGYEADWFPERRWVKIKKI